MQINKRKRNNKKIGHKSHFEVVIESMKLSGKKNANKDLKGIVLLHPTCYPKDASRKILQMMFNETRKEKFKHALIIDKFMIACHNPDNIRRLMTPSSLKNEEECRIAQIIMHAKLELVKWKME